MSNQTPVYLLDKNVVRRTITGLVKVETGRELTREENVAIALLWQAQNDSLHMFIPLEASNLLRRFAGQAEIDLFMEIVDVMRGGRYFKRWARRLREHGFTREDAKVVGLGTFGTDDTGDILGASAVVTLDQPLINNYEAHFDRLQERLRAMTVNLSKPFSGATLPSLVQPAQALAMLG